MIRLVLCVLGKEDYRGKVLLSSHYIKCTHYWHDQSLSRGSSGKDFTCQCRRLRFSPWVGKIAWRRKWQPTPVFLLENSMDREDWWATVHGVAKSWTWLSDFTFTFSCYWAQALGTRASGAAACGLSSCGRLCSSEADGIFLDQGLNLYPLYWQEDS